MTESKDLNFKENLPKNAKCKIKELLQKLKNHSFSKSFIAAIFLLLGIGVTLVAQSFAYQVVDKQKNELLSAQEIQYQQIRMLQEWQRDINLWINDFEESRNKPRGYNRLFDDFYDPFVDVRDVHKQMKQRFYEVDSNSYNFTKSKTSNSTSTAISQNEDKNFVYYRLNFKGYSKNDINIEIKDNYLGFLANKAEDKKSQDKDSKFILESKSNFLYSFYLPKNIDVKNPQIDKDDGQIIVKFKKI